MQTVRTQVSKAHNLMIKPQAGLAVITTLESINWVLKCSLLEWHVNQYKCNSKTQAFPRDPPTVFLPRMVTLYSNGFPLVGFAIHVLIYCLQHNLLQFSLVAQS